MGRRFGFMPDEQHRGSWWIIDGDSDTKVASVQLLDDRLLATPNLTMRRICDLLQEDGVVRHGDLPAPCACGLHRGHLAPCSPQPTESAA